MMNPEHENAEERTSIKHQNKCTVESILMAALGGSYDKTTDRKQPAAEENQQEPTHQVKKVKGLSVEDRMRILEVQVEELEKRNRALMAENRRLRKKCSTVCQKLDGKSNASSASSVSSAIGWAKVAGYAAKQGVFYSGTKKLRTLVPKPAFDGMLTQLESPKQLVTTQAVINIPTTSYPTFRSIPSVNVPFTKIGLAPSPSPPSPNLLFPAKSENVIVVQTPPVTKVTNQRQSDMLQKLDEQNPVVISKPKPNILRRSN